MNSINITDLCYANDGFTIVHCMKYKNSQEELKTVLAWVFGTFGVLFGFVFLSLIIETLYKKYKPQDECLPITPRDDQRYKAYSMS